MTRVASISFFLCSSSCIKKQYTDFLGERGARGGAWVGKGRVMCIVLHLLMVGQNKQKVCRFSILCGNWSPPEIWFAYTGPDLCLFVPILYWQLKSGALVLLMSLWVNMLEPNNLPILRRNFCFSLYDLSFFVLLISSCQVVSFELKDYSWSSQFVNGFQLFHMTFPLLISLCADLLPALHENIHLGVFLGFVCLFNPTIWNKYLSQH